ncbi:undecaprenyl phosphate translocase family protein [Alkaliphilus peptidifermentans]|uniref:Putative membrane protein n=1 Tax=Alkaliphilus peptidifermentans DSM 18978 TaxID=1120976 RepID=A0A1G5ADW7_9FIRM|nr:DUF368 domain-containing protein [Alkaliphilus peptidifermentans]SCX76068.1 putative membrane protein [Alkaliphilus peptidifermentans DSM 18978]
MHPILQGLILGFIIVLPGMSGGTVFVILGIYENVIKDLVKLNIKPYIPLMLGAIVGIFLGAMAFAVFFENHRDATAAFLLGCLLASIKPVLRNCPKVNSKRMIILAIGFIIGYYLVGEPISVVTANEEVSWVILFIGGAIASAVMIIPGLPGSSVLILFGIYDSLLFYIKELDIINLAIFGIGGVIGIFSLVKLLERLYSKHRGLISYSFAGLILGSSRALLPYRMDIIILILFVLGFAVVWRWSGKE